MNWDKRYLEGKVTTEGAVEAANKYVPELRAKGADLVVALLHGGLDGAAYSPTMENPGLYLSKVAGIDAMVMGHQHGVFPDTAATPGFKLPGVDHKAGTINGVPAVMASSWGKALGVVQLALQWDGTKWVVNKSASKSELRNIQSKNAAGTTVTVDADPAIAPLIETQHQAAIQYVKTPIGQTDFRMSTLFADVGDPGAIQIVNQAQQAYVAAYVKANLPQYAQLPVLSVSAPFKSGFQGGADYTDVAQEFVIATNNYRATSGKSFIDKLDGSGTIWASPDANRDVVIDYIRKNPAVTRTGNGAAKSWRFAKATVAGPVVFSSGANALSVAQAGGLANVSLLAADDGSGKGTSKYAIDLSK